MICPRCGADNGADFKFCKECAYPLKPESESENEGSDIEEFMTSGQAPSDQKKHEVNIPDNFFSEFDDDKDFDFPKKQPSNTGRNVSFFDDDDDEELFYDDDDDREPAPQNILNTSDIPRRSFSWDESDSLADPDHDKLYVKQKKDPNKSKSLALWLTTGIIALFVIGLFAFFLIRNYDGNLGLFFNCVFGSSPITRAADISVGENDAGDPAIIIRVYARKGMIVRFQEGDIVENATVENTSVTFCAPQSLWVPQNPLETPTLTIAPNIYVIDPTTNEMTKVDITPLEIKLPAATITLTKPETNELITDNSTIEIAGYVSDPSAGVFIGDNQLQTDQNGYFRGVYTMDALGEHEIIVEARKPGLEVARSKIRVTYTKSDIALHINTAPLRTNSDTIEISGTMDPGASISVSEISLAGDIKTDSAAGTFSFTANVPDIRLYTAKINLTAGNVTTTKTIYIEHAPDQESYISSARDFDYDYIVAKPTMDRHYEVKGKIVEVIQTDPYVIAKMLTTDNHYVIFNYYSNITTVEANDGKTYRLYANSTALDSDKTTPIMHCWFIKKSQ